MSTTNDPSTTSDPNLRWDGQRWWRWDGRQWVASVVPVRKRGLPAIAIVGIVVAGLLAAAVMAAVAIPVFLNQRAKAKAAAAAPWYPNGYHEVRSGLALRYADQNGLKCSAAACLGVMAIARDGCPHTLAVSVQGYSAANVPEAVGHASSGPLAPGLPHLVVVPFADEAVATGQITSATCS